MLAARINDPSTLQAARAFGPVDDRFQVAFRAPMNRREAEVLFDLDAEETGKSPGWTAYFVESLVEFLVFDRLPLGRIAANDTAWLCWMIGKEPSGSVPALLRALVLQTEDTPEPIVELAMRCGAMAGDHPKVM